VRNFLQINNFQPDVLYCSGSYSVVFGGGGAKFNSTSLKSLPKDMGVVILNSFPNKKNGGVKNLSSTRGLVVKLYIAIRANNAFRDGGGAKSPRRQMLC
jgi:hypothetical protein